MCVTFNSYVNKMKKEILLNIFRSKESVVSFKEILISTRSLDSHLLKRRLNYYVKTGELYAIRRGLYAKDKNYDRKELATKIFTPSYISFETVLFEQGVIFQFYSTLFIATYQTKEIVCDGQAYTFRKLKDTLLTNTMGVENRGNYFVATKERAFLDLLYLTKNYYIDNPSALNFEKIFSLLSIYQNKRMEKVVKKYFRTLKKEGDI